MIENMNVGKKKSKQEKLIFCYLHEKMFLTNKKIKTIKTINKGNKVEGVLTAGGPRCHLACPADSPGRGRAPRWCWSRRTQPSADQCFPPVHTKTHQVVSRVLLQ